jgi:sugar/nucleoside kinase (ribokinase family)
VRLAVDLVKRITFDQPTARRARTARPLVPDHAYLREIGTATVRDAQVTDGRGVLGVVGDLVEDVVVWTSGARRYATDNSATVHRSRGGSAANVAAFASSSVTTRFIGCVGDDALGDMLIADLVRRGVDVRVQRRGRTGTIVVLVDERGERTMFPDRAASGELTGVPASWLDSVAVLHAPSYCFSTEPAATAALNLLLGAHACDIQVSLDASSTGMLEEYGVARYLDLLETVRPRIFFANAREAELLDVSRPQFAKTMTIVKDGARSTTVRPAGGIAVTVAVPPVAEVRDSTGAGDAFAAGFLAAHLRGADPVEATEAGHALARSVLLSPGATSA